MLIPIYKGPKEMSHWTKPPPLIESCSTGSNPNEWRAANNGRSTDNVRPDRGLEWSNSGLAGHFDWSFFDTNTLFSIQLLLNAL